MLLCLPPYKTAFPLLNLTHSLYQLCLDMGFSFQKNPQTLDPFFNIDSEFFGEKIMFNNQVNSPWCPSMLFSKVDLIAV